MSHAALEAILRLTVEERLEIVQELWDSIAGDPDAFVLTDEQREELERRLAAADADPSSGSPWEVVRERLLHPRR